MSPVKFIKTWTLTILTCLGITPVLAKKPVVLDSHKLAHVQSDQGEIAQNHDITYLGHVIATQGSRKLHANKLVIHRTKTGDVTRVVATGKPAKYQYQRPSDNQHVYIHANTIAYKPSTKIFTFIKNVWFNQAGNIFQGQYSTYNSKTDDIQSKSRNHERSKMILQPFEKKKTQ